MLPHIKAGKLRALAVTTAKRSAALPDVPTLDEAGLKGFDLGTWFGGAGPRRHAQRRGHAAEHGDGQIIQSADFRKKMDDIGADPIGNTPEQMARQIKDDTQRFARLVKEAKVVLE